MKKIIALFMMGLITILSPLTLKANTYSIDQPVIALNNHTLNEVFTATEKDLTDYEITSILDTPVYEGLSLRDIFETNNLVVNGDFSDGTINFSALYGTLSYDNSKAKVVGNGLSTSTGIDYNPNISLAYNEQIYIAGYIELDLTNISQIAINIQLRDSGGNFLINLSNNIDNTSNNQYISTIHISNNSNSSYIDFIRFIITYDTMATQNDKINYFDNIFTIPISLFTTAPSQAQLDEWLAVYLDPTSYTGYNDIDPFIFYTAPDGTIFNVTEMINNQVYSALNNDTFDNLSQVQIENQFMAWETLGLTDQTVLSYTDFLTFAPVLSVDDMNYWYNYYNLILEYDEVQAGILSDLEITILVIALVLFIIGIALAIYFKHKIMFFVTGLLWFVPIVIVPNIFIVTFSVIMIVIFGLLAFYNSQERDFD